MDTFSTAQQGPIKWRHSLRCRCITTWGHGICGWPIPGLPEFLLDPEDIPKWRFMAVSSTTGRPHRPVSTSILWWEGFNNGFEYEDFLSSILIHILAEVGTHSTPVLGEEADWGACPNVGEWMIGSKSRSMCTYHRATWSARNIEQEMVMEYRPSYKPYRMV